MNIKLFGYSISLNVLILIGILYLIMVVNALSASCNMEGLKGPAGKAKRKKNKEEEEAEQRAAMVIQNELNKIASVANNMPKPLSPIGKQRIIDRLNNLSARAPNETIKNYVNDQINKVDMM